MPKSRANKSLQALLASASKTPVKNPNAVATKDAEASLDPLNVPDPKQLGEDTTQLVDAVLGEEGKTKELVAELPKAAKALTKFIGIGR